VARSARLGRRRYAATSLLNLTQIAIVGFGYHLEKCSKCLTVQRALKVAKINEVFTPAQRTIFDTSRKELQQRGRPGLEIRNRDRLYATRRVRRQSPSIMAGTHFAAGQRLYVSSMNTSGRPPSFWLASAISKMNNAFLGNGQPFNSPAAEAWR
jgi:hypothetical protein